MIIEWQNGNLVVKIFSEGERRVLESVVDSLSGLNRIDIHHCGPTRPDCIKFVNNQPISGLVDEVDQMVSKHSGCGIVSENPL